MIHLQRREMMFGLAGVALAHSLFGRVGMALAADKIKPGPSSALIVVDVDRLKPINDAFGHAAGDQVLKAIVAVLLRQVRSSDVVGRLGGDEFALLLWNLTETDARAKAASLEQAVDRLAFTFRGRTVTAGVSAGVAILGPHAEAGKALEEADSAMYVRKAQRRHEAS